MCRDAGVPVTAVPGACACVTALVISGRPTRRFCFEAFLPTDKKERRAVLEELKTETRTSIIYEAPHRLVKTLQELLNELGDRKITVCKELTKKHETGFETTLKEAVPYYERMSQEENMSLYWKAVPDSRWSRKPRMHGRKCPLGDPYETI